MLTFQKVIHTFAKIKPLKISILNTDPALKVKSQTSDHQWQVKNALENVLASLVACQMTTLKDMSHRANLKIHSIKFNKVESSYDLSNYMKGGSVNAEFETSGSQQELDAIHKKVQNSCPVYQMLNSAGVKITNNWKNTKKA